MTRHSADSCANCGAAVRAGEQFCASCGAPNTPFRVGPGGSPVNVAGSCGTCGSATSPRSRFCGSCGTPIAQAPAASGPPTIIGQPAHTVHDPQAAAAADPRSAQAVLQTIAATRPDLWPALARNPACQADLLDWLCGQHDDPTDRAILERKSQESSLGRRSEPDDAGLDGRTVIVGSPGPQTPRAQRPPLGAPAPAAAQSPPGWPVSGIGPPPNSGGEQMGWQAPARRLDGIRPALAAGSTTQPGSLPQAGWAPPAAAWTGAPLAQGWTGGSPPGAVARRSSPKKSLILALAVLLVLAGAGAWALWFRSPSTPDAQTVADFTAPPSVVHEVNVIAQIAVKDSTISPVKAQVEYYQSAGPDRAIAVVTTDKSTNQITLLAGVDLAAGIVTWVLPNIGVDVSNGSAQCSRTVGQYGLVCAVVLAGTGTVANAITTIDPATGRMDRTIPVGGTIVGFLSEFDDDVLVPVVRSGTNTQAIERISLSAGQVSWVTDLPIVNSGDLFVPTVIGGDRVVASGTFGGVVVLDLASGAITEKFENSTGSLATTDSSIIVVAGNGPGRFLDKSGQEIPGSPSLANLLYCGSRDLILADDPTGSAFPVPNAGRNAVDGNPRAAYDASGRRLWGTSPRFNDCFGTDAGLLFVSYGSAMSRLDLQTGDVLWSVPGEEPGVNAAARQSSARAESLIYRMTSDRSGVVLHANRLGDGQQIWQVDPAQLTGTSNEEGEHIQTLGGQMTIVTNDNLWVLG